MDALKKWMFRRFTSHQTTTLPKSLFLQKLFFKSSLSVPKVIDFPRFKMECNGENVILCGIFHVLYYQVFLYSSCYIAETWNAFLTVNFC